MGLTVDDYRPDIPQDPTTPEERAGLAFYYIGPGWAPGVPARHLTVEEAERIGRDLIRALRSAHTGEAMYLELPAPEAVTKVPKRKQRRRTNG